MIYLSICIPTYQRVEATRDTIKSIYDDIGGVSLEEFEVIVSDNDPNKSSQCFEEEFLYSNFHYKYTNCIGFLNSYYVLGYGKGMLLKLHNNTGRFASGALKRMIEFSKQHYIDKPAIFYSNNFFKKNSIIEYRDINNYLLGLGYLASWSAGFCIWREHYWEYKDIENINKMFPQTSLLLSCIEKSNIFYIDDTITRLNRKEGTKIEKRGGYNQFEVFGVQFNDLIFSFYQKGLIQKETYIQIKEELLKTFLTSSFIKTVILKKDNFDTTNINKHLTKHYGRFAYLRLWIYVVCKCISKIKRK